MALTGNQSYCYNGHSSGANSNGPEVFSMAAKAFVMVKVEPAHTRNVVDRLKEISGAVVYEVLGPYDVVLDIEADTQEDLTAVLRNSVRTQHGVVDTLTCICF